MASAASVAGLVIESLRGGMNDQDPPNAIGNDQVVLAENVEFCDSTLGERRAGMEAVDITDSNLDDEAVIVHMNTHYPAQTEVKDCHLWAIAATDGASMTISYRDTGLIWHEISVSDAFVNDFPDALRMHSQSIHDKMFIAGNSSTDRMHVWDGSAFRRTGLAAPTGTPTAMDSGVGTFADERTYRVRVIKQVSGTAILRSEPTDEYIFTPSGTGASATVDWSMVTPPNEGETHWELEASSGDGDFYILTVVVIGTTSYVDSAAAVDYADGELSADIGDYTVIPSFKFVKADQDRLVFAHAWEDETKGSRVAWTPVWKDPGIGNDERIPDDTDNFLDLDWMDGGDITDLSDPLSGSFYAFKWQRIYKIQRTGRVDQAYQAFLLSASHGAVEGSVVSGTDEYGKACVYFLDPASGPMRVGTMGIQYLNNIRGTWRRMNVSAANIVAHGVYYPDKQQLHWWVAVDGADTPNLKIVLHVSEVRSGDDITTRGWVLATGDITYAYCSCIVPEVISDETTGATLLAHLPYAGFTSPNFIQRCDIGSTDNGTAYRARIITKPYIVTGLLNKYGAMTAALLAQPLDDEDMTIDVKLIRDFGRETNYINTDFVPEDQETSVIKIFDNLRMSHATSIQIEFSDPYLGS